MCMIASTRFTGTSHYPAVFCILMVDANTWRLKSHLWGQQIAHVCVRRDEEKPVRPWATGRSRAPAREYPGAPARLRVRRIRMAAVPASADPGSSGCRGEAAGTRPGPDRRKRTQSQLPQRPLQQQQQQQQQQQRASHRPRGSNIGDSRGICPEPDRLSLAQVKSLATEEEQEVSTVRRAARQQTRSAQPRRRKTSVKHCLHTQR